jgi:hypothetical protein
MKRLATITSLYLLALTSVPARQAGTPSGSTASTASSQGSLTMIIARNSSPLARKEAVTSLLVRSMWILCFSPSIRHAHREPV